MLKQNQLFWLSQVNYSMFQLLYVNIITSLPPNMPFLSINRTKGLTMYIESSCKALVNIDAGEINL